VSTDHYKVLQVDSEAELDVIQAAYRRLARKYHPDTAADSVAAARMAAINAAWSVLRDPARRAEYDRERERQSRRPAHPPPATGPEATPPPARRRAAPPASGGSAYRAAAPDETSPHWTAGRSFTGGGYDPGTMRRSEGHGAAGAPPGNPSGSVLTFGRYAGWSLGEIARRDVDFLEWLDRTPIGRPYRAEVDGLLRAAGRRRTAPSEPERRGLFRRR
jgi:curved DNA-binding protein CbpA